MSEQNKTSTVGYFNSNDFPMQLVVSEYNLTINLKPKEWIFDRSTPAQRVTDPVLDKYVGKGKLSRATDPSKSNPVVRLVPTFTGPLPGQPAPRPAHSVTSAKGFAKDPQSGQLRPVVAQPSVAAPANIPPASCNPVKGYSMADARKLGLVRPTKQLKEDFGADESATGAPKAGELIPTIEVPTDIIRPRSATPAPVEVIAQPLSSDQHGVMESMTTGVAEVNPDDVDVVAATIAAVKRSPSKFVPAAQPAPLPALSAQAASILPPPIPANPTPTEIVEGPDPASMIVEEDLAPVPAPVRPVKAPAATKPPPLPAAQEAESSTKPAVATADPLRCPKCGSGPFSIRRYFKRHMTTYHPDWIE